MDSHSLFLSFAFLSLPCPLTPDQNAPKDGTNAIDTPKDFVIPSLAGRRGKNSVRSRLANAARTTKTKKVKKRKKGEQDFTNPLSVRQKKKKGQRQARMPVVVKGRQTPGRPIPKKETPARP